MAPQYIDQHGVQRSQRKRRGWAWRLLTWLESLAFASWIWRGWWRGGARLAGGRGYFVDEEDEELFQRGDPDGIPEADLTSEQRREALRQYSRYRDEHDQLGHE